MDKNISLVGLGKLGLCLSACLAEKGFNVVGVDIEESVVNKVNQGVAPWFEPQLQEFLAKHGGKTLHATAHHQEAIEKSNITFVLVATPSNHDGSFSNRFIESALKSLSEALQKNNKKHHLFIISSTVMPGSIEASFIPIIEKYSGRKLNKGFSICYDPDFVALGQIIKGFLQPELIVIGESDSEAGAKVEAIHNQICENKPVISWVSITNAELAKVCLNAYITTKISFANSLANLCEKIPNADVDSITKAIGVDRRISPYYFQGGLAFGGTCFPRDTHAYLNTSAEYGVQADIIQAVEQVNQYQKQHLAEMVLHELAKIENKTIGILGLAFTVNTAVVVQSPAINLIKELLKHNLHIIAYDPYAIISAKAILGSAIEYVDTPESCLEKAGLAVVTLRDMKLKQSIDNFPFSANPLTIIDCWRIMSPIKLPKTVRYVPLGSYYEK